MRISWQKPKFSSQIWTNWNEKKKWNEISKQINERTNERSFSVCLRSHCGLLYCIKATQIRNTRRFHDHSSICAKMKIWISKKKKIWNKLSVMWEVNKELLFPSFKFHSKLQPYIIGIFSDNTDKLHLESVFL